MVRLWGGADVVGMIRGKADKFKGLCEEDTRDFDIRV